MFSNVWPRTTRERELAGADEILYVSLNEALVLYAEIRGLNREAIDSELRDIGLLDSALMRPVHAAQYADADLAEQAATLIWGIAQNQAFIDGNKRLALVVTPRAPEGTGLHSATSNCETSQLMTVIS